MVELETHPCALEKVEQILKPILSPRQPLDIVEASLLSLSEKDQIFATHWVGVIAVSNIELSYTFATYIGRARTSLSLKGVRVWLQESLALYDREGLYPAMLALQDITGFKARFSLKSYTCKLEDVKPKLDVFIRGLAGRALALKPGEGGEVYTDTEFLYLPASISRHRDLNKNKALYKAMACFLWAQTWYGTFKRRGYGSLTTQDRLDAYVDPKTAKRYFLVLENIRLLAKLECDLPGLHREMNALSPLLIPDDKTWSTVSTKLSEVGSSVEDTFDALDILMRLNIGFAETDYQGGLNLVEVELKIEDRKTKALSDISELLDSRSIDESQLERALNSLSAPQRADSDSTDIGEGEESQKSNGGEISQEGESKQHLSELLQALLQDVECVEQTLFGDIPPVESENRGAAAAATGPGVEDDIRLTVAEREFIELDEWDYLRQCYRSRWCRVNITKVDQLKDGFRQQTERKYPFLITQIRKVFEAMRDQPRYANRQTDGDEIDLDAVVDSYTARLVGEELSDRVYIRRQDTERSICVCLLVDMSGSTKGWINLAMRESLILFSEALNTLGDQYAILGFSGLTRQRCEIYRIKAFSDKVVEETDNRISNIEAKDYTRMGFAVRYASRYLLKTECKHRILLTLSDGKPDDYDGYQGEYGIQDTRKAILEAQGNGINPYSIAIDKNAQSYLPRLFGPGQYMILNDVRSLPLKLSEVYKNLSN